MSLITYFTIKMAACMGTASSSTLDLFKDVSLITSFTIKMAACVGARRPSEQGFSQVVERSVGTPAIRVRIIGHAIKMAANVGARHPSGQGFTPVVREELWHACDPGFESSAGTAFIIYGIKHIILFASGINSQCSEIFSMTASMQLNVLITPSAVIILGMDM
jgi:hypothetical protein